MSQNTERFFIQINAFITIVYIMEINRGLERKKTGVK